MASNTVHLFVADGFADWEPALAVCELRQSGRFAVETFAISPGPVTSRAGLRVMPDRALHEVDFGADALVIFPGGDFYETDTRNVIAELLTDLDRRGTALGVICSATGAAARAGLFRERRHSSNGRAWLEIVAPGYADPTLHVDDLAVTDRRLVSASGAGHVEFAREILALMKVYPPRELALWFDLFKYGKLPPDEE